MKKSIRRYLIFFLFCYVSASSQEDSVLYYYNSGQKMSGEQLSLYTSQLNKIDSVKVFQVAQKILSDENRSDFFSQMGGSCYEVDNFDAAKIYYSKALEIDQITKDKFKTARDLSSLGDCNRLQDRMIMALDFLFKSTAMSKEIGNNDLTITNLSLIGDIYRVTEQPKDALKYLKQALAIHTGDTISRGKGFTYSCLGGVYMGMKEYKKAQNAYERGLEIAQSMNDRMRIIDLESSLGFLYIEQKSYEKARIFFERAMQMSKIGNDQYNLSICYIGLANVNYHQTKYKQAVINGLLGYEIGRSMNTTPWGIIKKPLSI